MTEVDDEPTWPGTVPALWTILRWQEDSLTRDRILLSAVDRLQRAVDTLTLLQSQAPTPRNPARRTGLLGWPWLVWVLIIVGSAVLGVSIGKAIAHG